MIRHFILLFCIILFVQPLSAQRAMEEFGKNRVQYKKFDWRYYSSENFDVYYYDGGQDLARISAEYLEEEFDRMTDLLGYAPYYKTKIFLYNSEIDLQQSNVGVNEEKYTIGGQTDFVKSHVEIAYPGTMIEFKDQLVLNISKMLINEMMFGGSLADMFQNAYLLNLPDWFMDGAAEYIANGWDIELDDFVRDFFSDQKIRKLSKYTGDEATEIGHSIWNFIAENYGKSNISNILNLTRIIRNEEKSIANTLGMPFRQFLVEWQTYYSSMIPNIKENYIYPSEELRLSKKNRKDIIINKTALSPDGRFVAYTKNNRGRFKVVVVDLENEKKKNALTGGYKVINQKINRDLPILSWADENNLGIIASHQGRNHLYIYNVNSNNSIKKDLGRLNVIRSFNIAYGGNLAVLSADIDGKNDIFLISLRRNSIKRITNDIYDDIHPKFVPNTNAIVFSSNRINDTLNVDSQPLKDIPDNYNLFVYSIDTTNKVLTRITNTLSKDINPTPINDNEILYLSDQKGIFNLYKYRIDNNLYNQVSNFALNIRDYDVNLEQDKFLYVMLNDHVEQVFLDNNFNFDNNIFTPQTRRQQVINAKFVTQRLREKRQKKLDSAAQETEEKIDQSITPEDTTEKKSSLDQLIESSTDIIDTDNYTFDEDVIEEAKPKESFLSAYRRSKKENTIRGPLPYETRFKADNIVTSFVIDPLIGFGIQLETQMNDLLENHKFFGGFLATTDLRSGKIFAEYQYLKDRIDYHLRYDRKILLRDVNENNVPGRQKYVFNQYTLTAALPVSVSSRFSVSPFYANTSFFSLDPRMISNPPLLNEPSSASNNFMGMKLSYTFDNSVIHGLNLIEGTRAKVNFTHYESISDNSRSFSNVSLDIRNYQKIYRELIFATRLFYGRFLGNNKQNYLLGGMDNWILNRTNLDGDNNPLLHETGVNNSNILFVEYLTSLRGFDYNTFFGSNALLFNAELRLPIVKLFYRGPIASNFFRNLQFIGFYDIGSAWTGNSPFATENDLNTEVISNDVNFTVRLKNYKNPWLSSYGFGVRTVLLGYYVKFDMAYPIEDYVVKDPKYYVTLGFDF